MSGLPLIALLLLAPGAHAQATRPPEVTDSGVAAGKALFFGRGGCYRCHGPGGSVDSIAPPLTGAIWFDGPGTYEWLVEHITHGVPAHRSMAGVAMPQRGIGGLTDEEIREVAAYVWLETH